MINFNDETKEFLAKVDKKYSAQHLMNGIADQIEQYNPGYINRCVVNVAQGGFNNYYGYNQTNTSSIQQLQPFIQQVENKVNPKKKIHYINENNDIRLIDISFDIPIE